MALIKEDLLEKYKIVFLIQNVDSKGKSTDVEKFEHVLSMNIKDLEQMVKFLRMTNNRLDEFIG